MRIPQKRIKTDAVQIDIELLFDRHYGHKDTDYEYILKSDENFITRPFYRIWGGDIGEFAIGKHEASQKYTPDEQMNYISDSLQTHPQDNIIFITGNHEENRVLNKHTVLYEYDPFAQLCRENKILYSVGNTYLDLHVNKLHYFFYLSHGRTSARRAQYPIEALLRDGIVSPQVDFVIVGHTHHNNYAPYKRNYLKHGAGSRFNVKQNKIWGIRPGSTLLNPRYIRSGFPRPEERGHVILSLGTLEKKCYLFSNLEEYDKLVS